MNELESRQPALFRRRRFEAPHRRRHPLRRLLRPLLASLALVGVPAVLAWWVLTSPQFEVREVEVASSQKVPAEWVERKLSGLEGRHLFGVRLHEVENLLAEHAWIAGFVLQRELPGRLSLTIEERRPAALFVTADGLFVLDRSGRPIDRARADGEELDLPVISAAHGAGIGPDAVPAAAAQAIGLADRWQRLRPGDRIAQVEILSSGDFRLVTEALPFTVIVSPERLETAPAALARALPWIEHHGVRTASVDLRFSRQIVFQPAATPPGEEG